jgi:hypothetical protein
MFGYRYTLSKELIKDKWRYVLWLELPAMDVDCFFAEEPDGEFFNKRTYIWETIDYAGATSIILAAEENGKLKEFFEKKFAERWMQDELVMECTYDDRFDLWMERLERTTANHLLDWSRHGNHFSTRYDNTDIKIEIDMDSSDDDCAYLYVRNQSGDWGLDLDIRQSLVFMKRIFCRIYVIILVEIMGRTVPIRKKKQNQDIFLKKV